MADVAESSAPVAIFKKRGAKKSSNIRKRPATPPPASDSSSDGDYSSEDESGRKIKRPRKNGITIANSSKSRNDTSTLSATKFDADKSAIIQVTSDATRQSNWYDDTAKDALSAKQLLGNSSRSRNNDDTNSGTYRGNKEYSTFIEKNPNAPSRQVGPVKAPTNIRTITVTDFAPDVCKDYKQTGFCGFGDNCKFLHAREDYKQGWELERDWEVGTKGKKVQGKIVASANRSTGIDGGADDDEDAEDALLESIPFACFICKEPYKNPIVTKCGHYFCEKCALDKYRKTPACAACGAGTGGVFNGAKNLKRLLEKKRERIRRKKEKAREEGEEVSGDEDGEGE